MSFREPPHREIAKYRDQWVVVHLVHIDVCVVERVVLSAYRFHGKRRRDRLAKRPIPPGLRNTWILVAQRKLEIPKVCTVLGQKEVVRTARDDPGTVPAVPAWDTVKSRQVIVPAVVTNLHHSRLGVADRREF